MHELVLVLVLLPERVLVLVLEVVPMLESASMLVLLVVLIPALA